MTLVSNPNGLLIASALFALSGLAILARALFEAYESPAATDGATKQSGRTKVAVMAGVPLLAIGLFLNGAGQFATGRMGPGVSCLLLALAFSLLLYVMYDGLLGDEVAASDVRSSAPDATPRLVAPQPPKLIAVEARDGDQSVADASRQALPA